MRSGKSSAQFINKAKSKLLKVFGVPVVLTFAIGLMYKGLPKLTASNHRHDYRPNRRANKAEILHGGFKYPHDKVQLAKDCMKLHLKKVNFLQFFEAKFGIF